MSGPADERSQEPGESGPPGGRGSGDDGGSVPRWTPSGGGGSSPSVPEPREGDRGWAAPGGTPGPGHDGDRSREVPSGTGSGPGTGPSGGPFGGAQRGDPGGRPTGGWAPKPGIVPLRPLGLGEILDGAVSYVRAHPRVVLGTSAAVAVVAEMIGLVLRLTGGGGGPTAAPDPTLGIAIPRVTPADVGASVLALLATVVLSGLLMVVISRSVLGASVDGGEAWQAIRPRIGGLIGIALLTAVLLFAVVIAGILPGALLVATGATAPGAVLLVLGLLAGAAAAIGIVVLLSLAPPAYVLEDGGITTALRRSWELVRPRFWPVLGIELLAFVIAAFLSVALSLPFLAVAALASGAPMDDPFGSPTALVILAVGQVLATTIVTPFRAGVVGLLYVDQRMRREGFDIELQRAARREGPPR